MTYAALKVANLSFPLDKPHAIAIISSHFRCGEGSGRVNADDVAQAHELALAAVGVEEFTCEIFHVHSNHDFIELDYPRLITNPSEVLDHYYPGTTDKLIALGLTVPPIPHLFDIEKSVTRLGYDP